MAASGSSTLAPCSPTHLIPPSQAPQSTSQSQAVYSHPPASTSSHLVSHPPPPTSSHLFPPLPTHLLPPTSSHLHTALWSIQRKMRAREDSRFSSEKVSQPLLKAVRKLCLRNMTTIVFSCYGVDIWCRRPCHPSSNGDSKSHLFLPCKIHQLFRLTQPFLENHHKGQEQTYWRGGNWCEIFCIYFQMR